MKKYVTHDKSFNYETQFICFLLPLQVRERLRVALERNSTLEEELASTKDEVSDANVFSLHFILEFLFHRN